MHTRPDQYTQDNAFWKSTNSAFGQKKYRKSRIFFFCRCPKIIFGTYKNSENSG